MIDRRCCRALPGALALLVLLAAGPAAAGRNVWTPVGPDGTAVWALAVDPAAPLTAYVSTARGTFKTADGTHWLPILPVSTTALAVDPRTPSVVYVADRDDDDWGGAVWRSADGGQTWEAPVPLPGIDSPRRLAVDAEGTVYLIDSYKAVAISRDGGTTWTRAEVEHPLTHAFAVDGSRPGRLCAGAYRGVQCSTDGGATWTFLAFGSGDADEAADVTAIAFHPDEGGLIFAGTYDGGLLRTRDGGQSWERIDAALPAGAMRSLAVDVRTGVVYVGTSQGVFESADRGDSWTATALDAHTVSMLAAEGTGPTLYAAIGSSGLLRSDDGGASFGRASSGLGSDWGHLAVAATGTLHVGADGVFTSSDGGTRWSLSASGLRDSRISAMAAHPHDPQRLFVGTLRGVFESRDGGHTWQATGLQQEPAPYSFSTEVRALAIDPVHSDRLYAGTWNALFISDDGGATWRRNETFPLRGFSVSAIGIDPRRPQTVYVASDTDWRCGLFRSPDGGATWRHICPDGASVEALAVDPHTSGTLYAQLDFGSRSRPARRDEWRENGLYKSTDSGRTWTRLPLRWTTVRAVAVDPHARGHVYAATYRETYRSEDGGRTWELFTAGLPSWGGGHQFAFGAGPGRVYLTTDSGVFGIERVPLCRGDCDGDGVVGVAEIVAAVAESLDGSAACPGADADGSGQVDIAELIAAVRAALQGCLPLRVPAYASPIVGAAAETAPLALFPGDADGDGHLDVLAADDAGVTTWLGDGLGRFTAGPRFVLDQVTDAKAGDWDGDGRPDLLVVTHAEEDWPNPLLHVLLNAGDGQFTEHATYRLAEPTAYSFSFATADLDGDGVPDLVASDGNGSVDVRLGAGDGTFAAAQRYATGCDEVEHSCPEGAAVGDVTGDGRIDVVLSSAVLPGGGDGTLGAARPGGHGWYRADLGDLDADGALDAALVAGPGVLVRLGAGDGTFAPVQVFATGGECRASTIADLNNDGAPDVLCGSAQFADEAPHADPRLHYALNDGAAVFAPPAGLPAPFPPAAVTVADVDADGLPDVIAASGCREWDPPACDRTATGLAVWLAR